MRLQAGSWYRCRASRAWCGTAARTAECTGGGSGAVSGFGAALQRWVKEQRADEELRRPLCRARPERNNRVSARIMDDTQDPPAEIHKRTACATLSGHPRCAKERTERVKSMSQKSNKRKATYFIFLDCFACVKSLIFAKSKGPQDSRGFLTVCEETAPIRTCDFPLGDGGGLCRLKNI